jgi:hypothetical protein
VTVNFTQPFNEEFQRILNARLFASGKLSRDQRLQPIVTPFSNPTCATRLCIQEETDF